MPGASRCYIADDGVSAEGETAHRARPQLVLANKIEHSQAGKAAAFTRQGGGAAIDVVIAGGSGRELELSQAERDAGQHLEQRVAMGKSHQVILPRWRKPPVPKNRMVKMVPL